MKYLRAIYGRRTSFGSITAGWPCGIVCGIQPSYESERMEEVHVALQGMVPDEARHQAVFSFTTLLARTGDSLVRRRATQLQF